MAADDAPTTRPLWRQVLDDLEARLAAGDIAERFPTDRELVERYGVSRHTVREAVRRLAARGVVSRERGRGSYVTQPEFVQGMGAGYSLFRAVESHEHRQTSDVLALDRQPDARAAERFGLDPRTPLVHVVRLRHADDRPLALDTVWLPPALGAALLDADLSHTSLYDELERRVGVVPTEGEERVTPVVPDAALTDLLALEPDEGVLRLERVGRHAGRTIECRITLVRGSRFALVARWGPGTAPTDG